MSNARDFPPFYPTPLMRRLDPRLRRLYALYNRALWRTRPKLTQRAALIGWTALWPMIAPVVALRYTTRYGRVARERSGVGRLRQWWDQVRWSVTRGMPPYDYYSIHLHEPGKADRLDDYLWYDQGWRMYEVFNAGGDVDRMVDKSWFARRCSELGVRCIPTVMELNAGAVTVGSDDPADLPPADLFAKHVASRSGAGAGRFRRADDGGYTDTDGVRLTPAQLIDELKRRSVDRRLIVQPALRTHDALRDLAPDALGTARVLTLRTGDDVVPICAVYKIPRAGMFVDNMGAGSIAAPIDLDTGRLAPATGIDPVEPWFDRHPDTEAPIAGRVLPDWPEALALCVDAHRRFDAWFVGWDVGLTDDGPVLVEPNAQHGSRIPQIPHNRGIFDFPGFLDGMLAAAEAASDRSTGRDPQNASPNPAR